MSNIELHQTDLAQQMEFARNVVVQPERGGQSILPREYQGNPANVLIAVGLGSSMGLSPAESLYRITVIQGKPTASAELIAANVRKAGHKLRVRGDETSCTATIIRADDPDYEFTVTRDMEWARSMGLTSKDNYKKQPGTMLQWRAITAVARLACPEALYGVVYSSDEIAETERPAASSERPAGGGLGAALAAQQQPTEAAPESPYLNPQSALGKRMFATFNEAGITDKDDRLGFVSATVGREVATSKEMTEVDAEQVIAKLREVIDSEDIHDAEVVDGDEPMFGGDQ